MNFMLLTAGIFAFLATMGHFIVGTKDFLKPVLKADLDAVPKKVMHSLFHYMSVFMILTTTVLFVFAFNENLFFDSTREVVLIIGIIYGGFGLVQFVIALTSGIKNGVFKLFQWIFWFAISIFSIWS